VVRNDFGAVTSAVATLTMVNDPPTIGEQSADQASVEGEPAYFSVQAFSPCASPSYQWRFNDRDLPGETDSTFVIDLTTTNHAGAYTVVVGNPFASVTSAVMRLTVLPPSPPSFGGQPVRQIVGGGSDVVLEPAVYPALLLLQWFINGEPIPGATNRLLVLPNATTNDSGVYTLGVANSSGTVTSEVALLTVKPKGPLDRWTWRHPLPQGNDLISIAYGNDTFVATGAKGALLASHDGVKWQSRPRGQADFSQVVFALGRFVAVGQYGTIVTSPDGVVWTRQESAPASLLSVAYGNGMFVASVAGKLLATSSDGVHWSFHPGGLRGDLLHVAFGGGQFVGLVDRFRLSECCDQIESTIALSTSGSNWIQNWLPVPGEYATLTFANDRFLAFERGHAGGVPRVIRSNDGRQWSDSLLWFGGGSPAGLTYGNGLFVGAGYDFDRPNDPTDAPHEAVFVSPDGADWTVHSTGATGLLSDVAFGNGRFVAVGNQGSIATSTNGTQWTLVTSKSAATIRAVAYGPRTYVAIGDGGLILKSADGTTWIDQPSGTTANLLGLTFAEGRFVAVGTDEAFHAVILSSEDGSTWIRYASSAPIPGLSSVAHGASRFVAVGGGNAITSPDGVAWTVRTVPGMQQLNAVSYGMGKFVAVGCGGVIATSPLGTTWNLHSAPGSECLNAVAVGTNLMVAVGPYRVVLTSSDGVSWTSIVPPDVLETVSYAAGMFVAAAANGRLYSSTDGVEWVRHETVTTSAIRNLKFANGTLMAVGDNQTILQSGYFPTAFLRVRLPFTSEGFEFSVSAEPGRVYLLQASIDLVHWVDLLTFTNSQELTVFLDTEAPFLPMRFYRVVAP
jgi:hypothetical protein